MKMSAVMDSRTDLYNRAYGIEKATELLRSGNSIALLLVDIDNFAEYNRIYGNEKADEAIKATLDVVNEVVKQGISANELALTKDDCQFLVLAHYKVALQKAH